MGMGESGSLPERTACPCVTRHAEALGDGGRSAGMGSMPMSDSGRLTQPLSKHVVQDGRA